MPMENAGNYGFHKDNGYLNQMNEGQDSETALDAGVVGEVAYVELGESGHGNFSEYFRLALGGFPDPQLRTKEGRIHGNIDSDDSGTDSADATEIQIRLVDKQRQSTYASTRWFSKDELEASDIENLPTLRFDGINEETWIREGRIVAVKVRNQQESTTVSQSGSQLVFPFVGAN
jgi:hypothetical protein